ncbi:hypothetical protein [Nocardioides sp.]|uniref:hypothetical protein n=1 Tax=Nocardioides sp. TaxID=35761 RepID=UPI003529C9C2
MGLFDEVGRSDVLSAIEEYDKLGGEEFLGRYGFGPARDYVLWHDGRTYDAKAVLGVARKFTTGAPASSEEFRGGVGGAASLLTELGFHVTATDVYAGFGTPVTGSWREADDLGGEAAGAAWAAAARDVLLQAAKRYRATVGGEELRMQAMYRTGIRSDEPDVSWLTDVLGRVTAEGDAREEPVLASLCVGSDGRVVSAYAQAVAASRGPAPADPSDHALRERLSCYRHFRAAGLPADGGSLGSGPGGRKPAAARPRTRTPRTPRAPRSTEPRQAPARRPTPPPTATCPTCFMALPVTGVCDNCG